MSGGGERGPRNSTRAAGRRSVARLFAVQALYEIEFSGAKPEAVAADFAASRLGQEIDGISFREADTDWFGEVVRGVAKRSAEIDEHAKAAMPRSEGFDRLEAILRLTIRCAAYELLARIDVPAATVIDEYLGVVRAFFGPREIKLANGILDGLGRRLRPGEFQPAAG